MPEFDYDINPVRRIIVDAEGEPGDRTFYIQASSGTELLSLVLEKEEVANLAISILSLVPAREVAAYVTSSALGWHLIPPTILRDGEYGIGSVQFFVEYDVNEHYFTFQEDARFTKSLR